MVKSRCYVLRCVSSITASVMAAYITSRLISCVTKMSFALCYLIYDCGSPAWMSQSTKAVARRYRQSLSASTQEMHCTTEYSKVR